MKQIMKTFSLFSLCLLIFLFAGCKSNGNTQGTQTPDVSSDTAASAINGDTDPANKADTDDGGLTADGKSDIISSEPAGESGTESGENSSGGGSGGSAIYLPEVP